MKQQSNPSYKNYSTGHPWYYFLDGRVLTPKQILENTRSSGYKGYLEADITKADHKHEPKRSHALRELRCTITRHLREDLTRYRQLALGLHRYRRRNQAHVLTDTPQSCADIHNNICLKHNHLANDFAHLIYIDDLLSRQGDLFGLVK